MTEKTVYKSGYFPIKIEGCSSEELADVNSQFLTRLKELRKNYLPGDKEIDIIDDILNEKPITGNDVFFSLSFKYDDWETLFPIESIPGPYEIKIINLIIFPWSWIRRGHKARNDVDREIKRLKKHFFRIYKHNLHKRSKFYKLRKTK